jgi:hypothetical protein
MIKTQTYIKILFITIILSSCVFFEEKLGNKMTIASVIDKYDELDFGIYKGYDIIFRQKRLLTDVIVIGKISIDSSDIGWYSCGADVNRFGKMYLRGDSIFNCKIRNKEFSDSIKRIVKGFIDLELIYLKVDYENNVFLSPPYYSFEMPLLLRIDNSYKKEHIRFDNGDGYYTHIKGNWYISDFYLDDSISP